MCLLCTFEQQPLDSELKDAMEDMKKIHRTVQSGATAAADELLAIQANNRSLKRQVLVLTTQKDEMDGYIQVLLSDQYPF